MDTALFDFALPGHLIAQQPVDPRDAAHLLAVGDSLHDRRIPDLLNYLRPGDVLVFNDTRVIPARLFGRRGAAGVEVTLHRSLPRRGRVGEGAVMGNYGPPPDLPPMGGGNEIWYAFARPAKRLRVGDRFEAAEDFFAEVVEKLDDGQVALAFNCAGEAFRAKLERHGIMPLPPYIRRGREGDPQDISTYQTVYARNDGAVAAPTAGLHFTEALLARIDAMGVRRVGVTLHVGAGTFLPVKAEDTRDHKMHSEFGVISPEAARAVNAARERGGRVVAIGTTSLRLLESAADEAGRVRPWQDETDIFITPGYRFKAVDMLLTNFHLPRSTLFMLVCAFAGTERMKQAYAHAIAQGYRFYSYGDACLLHRSG